IVRVVDDDLARVLGLQLEHVAPRPRSRRIVEQADADNVGPQVPPLAPGTATRDQGVILDAPFALCPRNGAAAPTVDDWLSHDLKRLSLRRKHARCKARVLRQV